MTESVDNTILIKARKGLTITAKDSTTFKIDMYQATVQIRGRNSQPTINFFPVSSFRPLSIIPATPRLFHSSSPLLPLQLLRPLRYGSIPRYQLSVYSVL